MSGQVTAVTDAVAIGGGRRQDCSAIILVNVSFYHFFLVTFSCSSFACFVDVKNESNETVVFFLSQVTPEIVFKFISYVIFAYYSYRNR